MKLDLKPEEKMLNFSLLSPDGLKDTALTIDTIIPITPFDYREMHKVCYFVILSFSGESHLLSSILIWCMPIPIRMKCLSLINSVIGAEKELIILYLVLKTPTMN